MRHNIELIGPAQSLVEQGQWLSLIIFIFEKCCMCFLSCMLACVVIAGGTLIIKVQGS